MTKSSTCNKGKALHISQWIKGELGGGRGWDGGGGRRCRGSGNNDGDGGDDDEDDGSGEDEDLELWSAERMNAVQAEVQRRLSSMARDECGGEATVECVAETLSVVSSPDDSQKTVVPENVCNKCHMTCDINGNQNSDAFLDLDPDNKWKPSTVSVTADLSPCEPFGNNNNNNNNNSNYENNNNRSSSSNNNIINNNIHDKDSGDDDEGPEPNQQPYLVLSSLPPPQRYRHPYQQLRNQQIRDLWFSSTSSLDWTEANPNHSTDSLDRVEFCSTSDYRWPEDFCPVTSSCCLPTDEDYNYDASSEEFWGTPNSSTTSPLSVEVNYTEERQNEPLFAPVVTTSSTPKRRPARLEPLIEEIESSDNTPSYELKETVYGERQTLLNFKTGSATTSKDKNPVADKSTAKNLFNMLWRTPRTRSKRTCGGESKLGTSFIRRRRIKSEKSKQNKEIKLNLIESVYLLLFG